MADAYVVKALRTAGGRRGGRLAGWRPADLAAEVLNALVDWTGIDPTCIDGVVMGCVCQVGEQSFHIARNAVLASRLPKVFRPSRPTGNADRRSKPCTSRPKP